MAFSVPWLNLSSHLLAHHLEKGEHSSGRGCFSFHPEMQSLSSLWDQGKQSHRSRPVEERKWSSITCSRTPTWKSLGEMSVTFPSWVVCNTRVTCWVYHLIRAYTAATLFRGNPKWFSIKEAICGITGVIHIASPRGIIWKYICFALMRRYWYSIACSFHALEEKTCSLINLLYPWASFLLLLIFSSLGSAKGQAGYRGVISSGIIMISLSGVLETTAINPEFLIWFTSSETEKSVLRELKLW